MEVQIGTDPPPQPVPRAITKKVIGVVFFLSGRILEGIDMVTCFLDRNKMFLQRLSFKSDRLRGGR